MKTIEQVSLKGKRVLIRVDFNLPLDESLIITDDSRMVASLPTIKKVVSDGGMAIIMSHLGRPKGVFEKRFSLKNIVPRLSSLLDAPVCFSNDCVGKSVVDDVRKMKNGDILVLENLRFHNEEVGGDEVFAKRLASLGDIYVNDAFGVTHRPHASTAIVPRFFPRKKYFGFLLAKEIFSLKKALNHTKRPFTAIIGGAKISGKIDAITSLFNKVDNLIIGGGMAYTFAKALGGNIGKSLVENEKVLLAKNLINLAKKKNVVLLLPSDSLNARTLKGCVKTNTSNILSIKKDYMGLDIGKDSIAKFVTIIANSQTIIWNGPMGVFETEGFELGTKEIAKAICLATANGSFSLVGGGDSVAALKKFNLEKGVSYLSTGGGAMLEYLEGKKLPGIAALMD